jgi:hypothetical protein
MARKEEERKKREQFQKQKRVSDYHLKKLSELVFAPIVNEVRVVIIVPFILSIR